MINVIIFMDLALKKISKEQPQLNWHEKLHITVHHPKADNER